MEVVRRPMRMGRNASLAILALGLVAAAPAHAYLDPGTGSYVFQVVVAAVVSVSFLARTHWQRLRRLFTRRQDPPPRPHPEDEV